MLRSVRAMTEYPDFAQALADAVETEELFGSLLEPRFRFLGRNDDARGDVMFCRPHETQTLFFAELKDDRKEYPKRGNIFIESHQGEDRRRSGINKTISVIWVHRLEDQTWIIFVTVRLKEWLCSDNESPRPTAGDNKNRGRLVRAGRLFDESFCRRVDSPVVSLAVDSLLFLELSI